MLDALVDRQFLPVDRGALGHREVRLEGLHLQPELAPQPGLDLRHLRGAADQQHAVHRGVPAQRCLLQDRPGEGDGVLQQVRGELLERLPGQRHRGLPALVADRDPGLLQVAEGTFAALGAAPEVLKGVGRGQEVLRGVRVLLLPLRGTVPDDLLVPVPPAEPVVALGGDHRDRTVLDLDDRDVEGAAAEVVDEHGLIALVVGAVRDRGGRGLVDDLQHLEAGDAARGRGRLALRHVEVRRARDDHLARSRPVELRGVVGDLAQDVGGDLLGGDLPAEELPAPGGSHLPFDHLDDVVGVENGRVLGLPPHDPRLGVLEQHYGRGDVLALKVRHDGRFAAGLVDVRDARVRGPQVDPVNPLAAHSAASSPVCSFDGVPTWR